MRCRQGIFALVPALSLLVIGCQPHAPARATPAPSLARDTQVADREARQGAARGARGARGAGEEQRALPALPPRVVVTPEPIFEGTLFLLGVRTAPESAPVIAVEGVSADRILTFVASADGLLWSVAPAPLDAREADVRLTVRYAGGAERSETVRLPILVREFPSEILTVPEPFANPPPEARRRIESERALVAETVRRVTPEALWADSFAKPREDRSSSQFGVRRMFNGQLQSRHLGSDIAGRIGEPVRASNSGRVALARDLYLSGNTVYIDHGLGLYTAYMHMSEVAVQEGDRVERGQIIGRVGATGRVTRPHLHWSVSFQGIPLDPEALVGLAAPPAHGTTDAAGGS